VRTHRLICYPVIHFISWLYFEVFKNLQVVRTHLLICYPAIHFISQLYSTAPFIAAVSVAGLYTAAFDLQVEWLVVKGIASYADGRESTNEKWSELASANAASLVAKILNDDVVFKRWPHYQGKDDNVIKGRFV